jgi:manganese-dependent inorganic pyrophosphatase
MATETIEDRVFVVGHRHPDTDSIGAAIAYAALKQALGDARVRPARAGELNPESRWTLQRFALPEPELLTRATGLKLILVDHNESAQALEDIAHADVLEVWEHHRIGDLVTSRPILFHCEPVGATATLIAEQYLLHEVPIPPAIAGALLAAILSDTLVLRSPTTCDKDRRMALRLAGCAGLDIETFGAELMAARGSLTGLPAAQLLDSDLKFFDFAGHRVGIAQIEVPDAEPLLERRDELMAGLDRRCQADGLSLMLLMLTDIGRRGSHCWAVGEHAGKLAEALGQPLDPDRGVWVQGWMSRKQQLVPALERAFTVAGG